MGVKTTNASLKVLNKEIEKEFDEEIRKVPEDRRYVFTLNFIAKNFISKKELSEELEKMQISYDQGLRMCGCGQEYTCNFKKGYNEALLDLKQKFGV